MVNIAATDTNHQPESWYWEAGSEKCPHGPEPEDRESAAWDAWWDRHPASDSVRVCLDAPMGDVCTECSIDHGEAVPWSFCNVRKHRRPRSGGKVGPEHEPLQVWVGTAECLERECDDYFTDDGDEITDRDRCSHIGVELICGGCSTRTPDGNYEPSVPWAGAHPAPLTT